jgi:hypothetical protein
MKMQLPESIQRLVNNVELMATETEVKWCLDNQQPLRLASGGGAYPGRASYGWIIQLGDSPVAKGNGPAYGDAPRSFRAEGYGMASALVYLSLLQQKITFTRNRRSINTIICDNHGLLTRIEEAIQWKYTTPNVTLRAEWDIQSVILSVYKTIDIQFEFLHVKSHQDDDGPLDSLSLETRLNVEADRLATAYLQQQNPRLPIALLFPTAKCQLIINKKSVTRKIPQTIRFETGSIDIRSYLTQRNLWTEATLDTINWDAHGASHSFHRPYRNFLVKMCHRHLPIGQTLHRRNQKYTPTCPGCLIETESQDHFLQCDAPSRIEWRLKLISTLRRQLAQLNTAENLQELILNCIDSAIDGRAIPTGGPFHEALESQETIGWLGMIRGYWSQEWRKSFRKDIHCSNRRVEKAEEQTTTTDDQMANENTPDYLATIDPAMETKK